MKISEINKVLRDPKMQDKNTNLKILGKTRSKFDLIIDRLDKIDSRLEKVESRLDNLEKLVITQFKKHKWIK